MGKSIPCVVCQGEGEVVFETQDPETGGWDEAWETCPFCHGTRMVDEAVAERADLTGRERQYLDDWLDEQKAEAEFDAMERLELVEYLDDLDEARSW